MLFCDWVIQAAPFVNEGNPRWMKLMQALLIKHLLHCVLCSLIKLKQYIKIYICMAWKTFCVKPLGSRRQVLSSFYHLNFLAENPKKDALTLDYPPNCDIGVFPFCVVKRMVQLYANSRQDPPFHFLIFHSLYAHVTNECYR